MNPEAVRRFHAKKARVEKMAEERGYAIRTAPNAADRYEIIDKRTGERQLNDDVLGDPTRFDLDRAEAWLKKKPRL